MKNVLISLIMMVALFGVADTSQGQSYDTEYQAVQKLEDSCTSVEVFGEAHALWEDGRLVARNGDENGNEITREVPVTKI